MINFFADGTCQIVIHTANLLRIDWEEKAEALWSSPILRRTTGERKARSLDQHRFGYKFQMDFLQYLGAYRKNSLCVLIEELSNFDFSAVRAIFVGSVPGSFDLSDTSFGLAKLRYSLRNAAFDAKIGDQTIAQISSLGSLGKPFYTEFQSILNTSPTIKSQSRPNITSSHFRLIFPTFQNVEESISGLISGLSLFFDRSKSSGKRQLELSMPHLHSWHASRALRDGVMPHIKTYARTNGDEIRWILVTSSNLSKAAWGGLENGRVKIKSYEAGVLLVSDLFMEETGQQVAMKASYGRDDQHTGDDVVNIRMCYDLDVRKYTATDRIWSLQDYQEDCRAQGRV